MTPLSSGPSNTCTTAIFAGGAANILLGMSSLYWRKLNEISPQVLVAFRILLSLIALSIIIFIKQDFHQIKKTNFKTLCLHCGASLLVAANWATFIWASTHGNIIESGFGYLLAPLLSITMGVIFYHEPLRPIPTATLVIISISALLLVLFSHELNPWIYIVIATTWGSYTCLKKATPLNSINGLFIETLFLSLGLALIFLLFDWAFAWPEDLSFRSKSLIWLAGGISVIPLIMFAYAISKLPLSTTGFFQFILPLTQLTVATLFYKQSISMSSLLLFTTTTGSLVLLLLYELASSQTRAKRLSK